MTSYCVRKSILEKPTTYTLTGDTIEIASEGKNPRTVSLPELTTVRLKYVPTKIDNRYFCTLKYKGGSVEIVLST